MRNRLLAAGKQTEFVRRYSSPTADLRHFPTANYLQELVEMIRPLPPLDAAGVPLLVLLSKSITAAALEATRRALAKVPHAELVLLDACHWPLTERPREVREAIERWCVRIAGSSARI